MTTRIRHLLLVVSVTGGLILHRPRRAAFARMREFVRELPRLLDGPLSDAYGRLETPIEAPNLPEPVTRRLADTAALLDRKSALGLCLRRSLVRFRFLRAEGVDITVHFGAQLDRTNSAASAPPDLRGHAWTQIGSVPYYERAADARGFTTMLLWPPAPDGAH